MARKWEIWQTVTMIRWQDLTYGKQQIILLFSNNELSEIEVKKIIPLSKAIKNTKIQM